MTTDPHAARPGARALRAAALLVSAAVAGCTLTDSSPSAGGTPRNPAAFVEDEAYEPAFDPGSFVDGVDNPYFPLVPGTTMVYEGSGGERVEVTVTSDTKEILGITPTVVRDQVFEDDELIEDTFDWYAQDGAGNVWYLGEATEEYENGEVVSTEGSWEAGVDDAQPGIIMLADPQVGDTYRQEFYEGEAEDLARVEALGESVEVPYGSFDDVLVTEDWTPLEPDVHEQKSYAPGVGVVFEEIVAGGEGQLELVEVREGD
jgi:hypothetical protein